MSSQDLLTVGAVLAMLLAVIVFNHQMAARARSRPRADPAATSASVPGGAHPLVGRFVLHEGDVVGEVVAVEGERAILRQAGLHRAVPAARLEPRGGDLVLVGAVDWVEAERAAADWTPRVSP